MRTFSTGEGDNLSASCALLVGCVLLLRATRGIYAWRVNSLKRWRCALEAEIVERKQAEEALRASQESLRRSTTQSQGLAARLIKAYIYKNTAGR